MEEPLDVLCAADVCVDLVVRGNVRPQFHQIEQLVSDYEVELGGSACIFASQFAKLGGRAGLLGWAGQDTFGDFAVAKLRELAVDATRIRRHPSIKTGLGVALAEPDDRAILTYLGTIDAIEPSELSGDLFGVGRHWHIASYFLLGRLRNQWSEWLRGWKAAGLTTSLDTNWDPDDRWEGVMDLLPWVDVFLPNEAEAMAISGEADLQHAGEMLASRGPLVVIKRGRAGVIAFQRDRTFQFRPEQIDACGGLVDAIGAGDNFDAGFLRAWLLGFDIDRCLALGCHCAQASLFGAGGITAQLNEVVCGPGDVRYQSRSS